MGKYEVKSRMLVNISNSQYVIYYINILWKRVKNGLKQGVNFIPTPLKVKISMGMKPIHSSTISLWNRRRKSQGECIRKAWIEKLRVS